MLNKKAIATSKLLKLSVVKKLLYEELGVFETERFLKKLDIWSEDYEFTYQEIKKGLNQTLEADLDNCINTGFTATQNVVKSDISKAMLE